MTKLKYVTQMSYKVGKESFEPEHGDSLAVPNEAYTPRELYEKYVRGDRLPPIQDDGAFIDQDEETAIDLEKVKTLDLVQIEEVRDALNLRSKEIRESLKKAKEALDLKTAEEEEARYNAWAEKKAAREKVQKPVDTGD